MTKRYPIFEQIPGIPIIDKYDKTKNKDGKIASTHGYRDNYYITENGEQGEIIKEETYNQEEQYEYQSYR